ncbi:hypothetical protein HDU97_005883, partial [Phlyctochytrium planicorne]
MASNDGGTAASDCRALHALFPSGVFTKAVGSNECCDPATVTDDFTFISIQSIFDDENTDVRCRSLPETNGRLGYLRIRNAALNIVLSNNIANLTALRYLDLRDNTQPGPAPDIGSLKNLEVLYLINSTLTGPIPDSYGTMPKLEYLHLNGNNLSGEIPSSFKTLVPQLSRLELGGNSLSGEIPSFMFSSPKLKYLQQIKRAIPNLGDPASKLKDTRHFCYLSGNAFNGSIPDMNSLKSLKELDLGQNQLQGTFPTIYSLTSLTILSLAGNQLTGAIPGAISALTNLNVLSLRNNQFEGNLPSTFGNLGSHVKRLYIENNQLTGSFVPDFSSSEVVGVSLLPQFSNCTAFPDPDANRTELSVGNILGITIGGIFGLGLIIGTYVILKRWQRRKDLEGIKDDATFGLVGEARRSPVSSRTTTTASTPSLLSASVTPGRSSTVADSIVTSQSSVHEGDVKSSALFRNLSSHADSKSGNLFDGLSMERGLRSSSDFVEEKGEGSSSKVPGSVEDLERKPALDEDPANWDSSMVVAWLESSGVNKDVVQTFSASKVTGTTLLRLNEDHLVTMGFVQAEIRSTILLMIYALRNKRDAAADPGRAVGDKPPAYDDETQD